VTLSGGGIRKVSPNDTRGEGGLAKVSRDSFSKILSYIHLFLTAFLKEKSYFFGKSKCHVTGGSVPVSPNDTWGRGGSKIGQKSVTYYLNGPLQRNLVYSLSEQFVPITSTFR